MTCRKLCLPLLVAGVCLVYSFHGRGFAPATTIFAVEPYEPPSKKASKQECEVKIDRRFTVGAGDALDVRVGDADLVVMTGGTGEARVEVLLDGDDMDRARRYFDRLNFKVEQRGNTIIVTHDEIRDHSFSFDRTGGAHITVRMHVPQRFDASLATSDGDVVVDGALRGRLDVKTSDGDISTGDVAGPSVTLKTSDGDVRAAMVEADEVSLQTSDGDVALHSAVAHRISLRTSDGDIDAERLQGATDVVTSDGDIRLGSVSGSDVLVRTSDGEIAVDGITAERAEVITSDGNIRLNRVDSALRASTSSGNVNVTLLKPADVQLRSTDGNIVVFTPQNLPADLRLKGSDVRISSSYAFAGTVQEEFAEGRINGGGPLLEASTSDGVVSVEAN